MKTLILHVGLHKTGSTGIQDTLGRSQSALREYGYHYPVFANPDGVAETNHSYMFQLVFKSDPSKLAVVRKKGWNSDVAAKLYSNQLKRAMDTTSNLILSGEGIFALEKEELCAVKALFEDWDIKVVCYVRPAYSFFCSAVQEQIKNGIASKIALDTPGRAESKTIARFQAVFDNIHFVSFPEACGHSNGPPSDFFHRFNLPYDATRTKTQTNQGLGNTVTRLCAHLNSCFPQKLKGYKNYAPAKFDSRSLAIQESRFILTNAELAGIRGSLENENEKLYRLTGIDFRDEKMKTAEPEQLSFGQSVRLVVNVLKQSKDVRREGLPFLINNRLIHRKPLLLVPVLLPVVRTVYYFYIRLKLTLKA